MVFHWKLLLRVSKGGSTLNLIIVFVFASYIVDINDFFLIISEIHLFMFLEAYRLYLSATTISRQNTRQVKNEIKMNIILKKVRYFNVFSKYIKYWFFSSKSNFNFVVNLTWHSAINFNQLQFHTMSVHMHWKLIVSNLVLSVFNP